MGVTPSSRKDIYIGQEEINGQFTVLPDGEKNLRIYSVSEIGDGEFVVFENNRTTIDIHANGPTQVTYSFRPPKNL